MEKLNKIEREKSDLEESKRLDSIKKKRVEQHESGDFEGLAETEMEIFKEISNKKAPDNQFNSEEYIAKRYKWYSQNEAMRDAAVGRSVTIFNSDKYSHLSDAEKTGLHGARQAERHQQMKALQ